MPEAPLPLTEGYLDRFVLARRAAEEQALFDVELDLSNGNSTTRVSMRFLDVRSVCFGNRGAFHLGSYLRVEIDDISDAQWDGVRFKVLDIEGELSLYCRDAIVNARTEGAPT